MAKAILTPANIRAAMVKEIQIAEPIAKVYPRRRVIKDQAQLSEIASDGKRIHAWFVSFAPTGVTSSERHPGHRGIGQQGGGRTITTFQMQAEGWYSLIDAENTEEAFSDIAWGVADRFNSFGKLNITGNLEQLPSDLVEFRYLMIGAMWLCHYARVEIGFKGETRPL